MLQMKRRFMFFLFFRKQLLQGRILAVQKWQSLRRGPTCFVQSQSPELLSRDHKFCQALCRTWWSHCRGPTPSPADQGGVSELCRGDHCFCVGSKGSFSTAWGDGYFRGPWVSGWQESTEKVSIYNGRCRLSAELVALP